MKICAELINKYCLPVNHKLFQEGSRPQFVLKNGTKIHIHAIQACDKECLSAGFAQMSPRTRYLRFFSAIDRLSEAQLSYLTEIDNINHVAIGAEKISVNERQGLGIARFIRLAQEPEIAEFAVTVIDAWQGLGLGSLLLERLIQHASENGIRILRGYVLESNKPMLNLLKKYPHECSADEEGILVIDVILRPVVLRQKRLHCVQNI